MKFENGRQINKNLATDFPSPPPTRAAVATTNVTPLCTPKPIRTPKRAPYKDTPYTTLMTPRCNRLGRVIKGTKERRSYKRDLSRFPIVLPSDKIITPAKPDNPHPIVTPSFIDSVVKGPTITHEMRRVAIATHRISWVIVGPLTIESMNDGVTMGGGLSG